MIVSGHRTLRVGLVADSHVGEFITRMPDWVPDALEGCDLILHAGDLSVRSVLDELDAIAPVRAVRGDHDRDADDLPAQLIVTVGGWRIGLTHGAWNRAWDATTVARAAVTGNTSWQRRLDAELSARLGAVDAVVYGHWHLPRIATDGPVMAICPGAVCPGGALGEDAPLPRSLHAPVDVAVRRFRRAMDPEYHRAAICLLEVGSSGLRAQHVFAPDDAPAE